MEVDGVGVVSASWHDDGWCMWFWFVVVVGLMGRCLRNLLLLLLEGPWRTSRGPERNELRAANLSWRAL